MRHGSVPEKDRKSLLDDLAATPAHLESVFAGLGPEEARVAGPGGTFSPVEQCWHLADLEREGFGERIRRLLGEEAPSLPDFEGDRVARERNYKALPLSEGIAAFRCARMENLAALRAATGPDWDRSGTQQGVGEVALRDIPVMMSEHDASHRAEIEGWLEAHGRTSA